MRCNQANKWEYGFTTRVTTDEIQANSDNSISSEKLQYQSLYKCWDCHVYFRCLCGTAALESPWCCWCWGVSASGRCLVAAAGSVVCLSGWSARPRITWSPGALPRLSVTHAVIWPTPGLYTQTPHGCKYHTQSQRHVTLIFNLQQQPQFIPKVLWARTTFLTDVAILGIGLRGKSRI